VLDLVGRVQAGHLEEAEVVGKEAVDSGRVHVEVEDFEKEVLHAQHLLLRVRVVGDVDEFVDVRWRDLLVLGGDVDTGCAD